MVKNPTISSRGYKTKYIALVWIWDMYREWKITEFPPKDLSMSLETKRLRGRP